MNVLTEPALSLVSAPWVLICQQGVLSPALGRITLCQKNTEKARAEKPRQCEQAVKEAGGHGYETQLRLPRERGREDGNTFLKLKKKPPTQINNSIINMGVIDGPTRKKQALDLGSYHPHKINISYGRKDF